ncbi:hypothetical protein GIB67_006315 [Kingdonia uniflora]|uniref:Glycosyltransferase n=1 Tax=Kingdonia uniflora TaxID=39325 RepID=A0A7J7P5R1_9MAGN|nr:hypothetical protein GIB67_006315 [Kingdonia uniflora]
MKKLELVLVPSMGRGHIVSTVELAKLLINHDNRFSVTILIMSSPIAATPTAYTQSVAKSFPSIRFIELPPIEPPPPTIKPGVQYLSYFIEKHIPSVRKTLAELKSNPVPIAGLVIDMFTTHMIDVANELGIPSYLYYTSGIAIHGFAQHFPTLHTEIATDFKDHIGDITIPSFVNPIPVNNIPSDWLTKGDRYNWILLHNRRLRETKGILLNSFYEVEPFAVESFANSPSPPVYPVGPLLETQSEPSGTEYETIMKWLDDQPPLSVIFLCFGSKGSFGEAQVKEIAIGLEKSGYRFLWALRKSSLQLFGMPTDYANFKDVLPDGFLDRTYERGMVCGWAPQVSVLAHKAIGGFVSHCGWNSILESLWFGVPILTWPLYAEQNLNAFELVKELELAEELRLHYTNGVDLVTSEEVESGVKRVMEKDSVVRRKVTAMKEISQTTKSEGGSSFESLGRFIHDVSERL